ncbi:MAG: hypothetical protein U1E65_14650 [Myxococcota bacterium]
MAIHLKLGNNSSPLEEQQVKARLDALGLKLNPDQTINEESAKHIAGGLAAVQALAKDGVLRPDDVALLRRQAILGGITGRDMSIDEKASNAFLALGLELGGSAFALQSVTYGLTADKTLNEEKLNAVFIRLGQAMSTLDKIQSTPNETLARIFPETVQRVAEGGVAMADALTNFIEASSLFRSAILKKLAAETQATPILLSSSQLLEQRGPGKQNADLRLAMSFTAVNEGAAALAELLRQLMGPVDRPSVTASVTLQPIDVGLNGTYTNEVRTRLKSSNYFQPRDELKMSGPGGEIFHQLLMHAQQEMKREGLVATSYGHTRRGTPEELQVWERPAPTPLSQSEIPGGLAEPPIRLALVPQSILLSGFDAVRTALTKIVHELGTHADPKAVEARATELLGKDAALAGTVRSLYTFEAEDTAKAKQVVRSSYGSSSPAYPITNPLPVRVRNSYGN